MKRSGDKERNVYGLFNDSFPPVLDGVTLTVVNYAKWLVALGKPVCVVTPWNPVDPPHPNFAMHRYFSLPIYNRPPYRYGYPRLDPTIWMKMRRMPFRIVHAHCPFSSGRLARYAADYHKVPLVATFHSKYRDDLRKGLPKAMCDYQMRRLRNFYNSADAVWIPQAAVEETVREYGITVPVTVVDNGNDLGEGIADITAYKDEARQRMNCAGPGLRLLFVGQHIEAKGVFTILDALGMLQRSGINFSMHFAGTGPDADAMRRRASQLGLDKRVTFHGVVRDREKLRDLYASADLFLFPSYYDNAPLVVREAATMLTPTILPIGSTASELIVDGENGFLAHADAASYAHLLSRLNTDRSAIAHAGEGARKTLSRPWENVVSEVLNRYEEIIDRFNR